MSIQGEQQILEDVGENVGFCESAEVVCRAEQGRGLVR